MAKTRRDPHVIAIRKDTSEIRKETKKIRKMVETPLKWDPTKDVKEFLTKIWNLLQKVWNAISAMPGKIVDAFRMRAGTTIAKIVQTFLGVAGTLVEPVAFIPKAINYLTSKGSSRRARMEPDRWHQFFKGLAALTVRINQLAQTVGAGVNVKVPEPIQERFLTQVFDQIPGLLLAPAKLIMDPIDGWEQIPGKIVSELDQLPSEGDMLLNQVRTNADTRRTLQHVRYIAKMVSVLVNTAISLLPRDLTVHIEIAGEGGGTQLMGHPAAWVFQIAKLVLDLTDVVIGYMLELASEPKLVARAA